MTAPTITADYLDQHLREMPPFRALIRAMECQLFDELGPFDRPMLDLGCGDGHFASMAFPDPPEIGIDLDPRSISEAHQRGAHRLVMRASATAIPARDGSFSTVVSNCVMEHIPDLLGTLEEVRRVIKPGGRFAFGVPSHRFADLLLGSSLLRHFGLDRLGDRYGRWFNEHSRHYHTYHPNTWLRLLDAHGFDDIHWQYYMNASGHQAFDVAHYLSVPNLVAYKITGAWVPWRNAWAHQWLLRWLRPHVSGRCTDDGAYIFFACRKR
ncbi:MAG: class I SAM-dependent DNA methyltransferase [Chloroflexota bacterium]